MYESTYREVETSNKTKPDGITYLLDKEHKKSFPRFMSDKKIIPFPSKLNSIYSIPEH